MKLTIFGANGPVGKLTTDLALDAGHHVRAVTRHPEGFPEPNRAGLQVIRGDVLQLEDVVNAIDGQDAVLSMVGVPYTFKSVTVYSVGIANLIEAMRTRGMRRIIAVTAGGTNPEWVWSEGLFWNLVLKSFLGRSLYADMRLLEEALMKSDLDWTVVRPAQLIDTDTVTNYRTKSGFSVGTTHKTSRMDLADYLIRLAETQDTIHQALSIATDA